MQGTAAECVTCRKKQKRVWLALLCFEGEQERRKIRDSFLADLRAKKEIQKNMKEKLEKQLTKARQVSIIINVAARVVAKRICGCGGIGRRVRFRF